jgi:hypothetical protein
MPEPRFRKGDHVRFRLGTRSVEGVVKEDRGPIGVKGRYPYLVEFRSEAQCDFRSAIELPAGELQSVPDTVSRE